MPGYDVKILDNDGNELPRGELGSCHKTTTATWKFTNLWNAEERFKKSYLSTFPGFYETGDAG